jgi:hypothetical protein
MSPSASLSSGFFAPASLPVSGPPHLVMVVDTEEEFDWSAPLSSDNVSVTAIDEIGRLQTVAERYQLKPAYVVDYPVATTDSSVARLGEIAHRGACEIGAHLHPWVNPPFVGTVSGVTSFACNLGRDLERQKIAALKNAIRERLGLSPRVYKAGRYGFGPTTAEILEALHFDVDVSVNPHYDFSSEGGPDFRTLRPTPGLFGRDRRLLELPCTTGFVGLARRFGQSLYSLASAGWLRPLRAVGVLSRSHTLNRVMLSPEGNTLDEMRALTSALAGDGVRTFALTLHSPSLKPGCTQYARTAAERDALVDTIDRYCEWFMRSLGGVPTTPSQLHARFIKV